MYFDKKILKKLLEFIIIFVVYVFPPMLNTEKVIVYQKPDNWFSVITFILKIFLYASYEEVLYRIYLPYRIKSFFKFNFKKQRFYIILLECFPIIFFALAHRYLGFANVVYAFIAGCIFRLLYIYLKIKYSSVVAIACVIIIHTIHNCISFLQVFINLLIFPLIF